MAEAKKYNNFSSKLLEQIPELKKGEKIRFQLLGIHVDKNTRKLVCPKSKNLPKVDRIWDPWAKKKVGQSGGGYTGDYIDVAYILRETPAGQDSMRDTNIEFGRIEFSNTMAGIIELHGGNRAHEKMLPMLFFSNRNQTNADKDWYIKPPGKPMFSQIKAGEKAKTDLAKEMLVDQAKALISNYSKEELTQTAAGLMPTRHTSLTDEEKTLALRVIAQNTPEKIIHISKDVEVHTTAKVEEFLKAHLIIIDVSKGQVQYADDKTMICTIKAGQTPHTSLKRYFMTDEGIEVLMALEKQLELSKKSVKDKTEKVLV